MTFQNSVSSAAGQPVDVQQFQSLQRSGSFAAGRGSVATGVEKSAPGSFADLLKTKISGLKVSAHAASRISSRQIAMTPEVMGKLEKAVEGAAGKGARESLVLLKNCAFIVNIPNRTVVTAMDGESLKNNIFTNIDSTVLAD